MSDPTANERSVATHLEADVTGGTEILMAIAVGATYLDTTESLTVTLDGDVCDVNEIAGVAGTRFHVVTAPRNGWLIVDYNATVTGTSEQLLVGELERFHYLRPSRYCESDTSGLLRRPEFAGLTELALAYAIRNWVNENIAYVLGSSRATDSAINTLLETRGVCRDFAHVVVALLRANDLPARVVSVYAPGLLPMDFHSVVEVAIDGRWQLLDATGLASRPSMVRIATGVDSSETAFLTSIGGNLTLASMGVWALTSPELLVDDGSPTYLW